MIATHCGLFVLQIFGKNDRAVRVALAVEKIHQTLAMVFRETKIGPQTYTLSGHSVFYKNAKGEIFHTYGTFGRGSEQFMGIYGYFDVLPKGREEYGPNHALPDWAKVHDQYEHDDKDETACVSR